MSSKRRQQHGKKCHCRLCRNRGNQQKFRAFLRKAKKGVK
jgi:hypothetical protein